MPPIQNNNFYNPYLNTIGINQKQVLLRNLHEIKRLDIAALCLNLIPWVIFIIGIILFSISTAIDESVALGVSSHPYSDVHDVTNSANYTYNEHKYNQQIMQQQQQLLE